MLWFVLLILLILIIIILAFIVAYYIHNKSKTTIYRDDTPYTPISLRKESIFASQGDKANVNFVVINISTHINSSILQDVIHAVETHTRDNFAPHWGTRASFTLLEHNTYPTPEHLHQGNVLVYIVDTIEGGNTSFKGIASHWMTLPEPEDGLEGGGPQPKALVPILPIVPIGVPIIFIPYGDKNYGLRSVSNITSPESIMHALGEALSHEVFETLVNPFPTGMGANFQVFVGKDYTHMYITEVCDPNEKDVPLMIEGIRVANFVTRDYFNPYTPVGIPLDWAKRIQKPFTPVEGRQYGLLLDHKRNKLIFFVDIAQDTTLKRYKIGTIHSAPSKLTLQGLRHITRDINTLIPLDYSLLPS